MKKLELIHVKKTFYTELGALNVIDDISFDINEGSHNIKIVYTSPLFKEGLVISCIGLVLFVGTVVYYRKREMW